MTSGKLQRNMLSTYFILRLGLVVLSAAFPLILYGGARFYGHPLTTSMSAYYGEYGALMRNWFVGVLWALGWFLYLYKGFSDVENYALNIAGIAAVMVAMVPCDCWVGAPVDGSRLHAIAAVTFFLGMAFVAIVCAGDTVTLLPTPVLQTRFKRKYRIIGGLLLAAPGAALLVSYFLRQFVNYRFFIEAFGVWMFGAYWAVKSHEFHISLAEKRALHGEVENRKAIGLVTVAPPIAPRPAPRETQVP